MRGTEGIHPEIDDTLFVLEDDPPATRPRWFCYLDEAGDAPGFDTPEEAVEWAAGRASGVVIRTLDSTFYLAGRPPSDWGEDIEFRSWPPHASERLGIDTRYAEAVDAANAEIAARAAYEAARDSWLRSQLPQGVSSSLVHGCVIQAGEDALIEYEEFDREAQRCGGRDEAGRMAFGGSRDVIAALLGPVFGDEWIDAILEALQRDRDPRWGGRRNELTIRRGSGEMYHVTDSANRSSIEEYGLDWRRMGTLRGIAGSREPELEAIFLCETFEETEFYTDMGRTPSDIWAANVDGLWIENGISGWVIVTVAIPPERVRLIERDVEGNRW